MTLEEELFANLISNLPKITTRLRIHVVTCREIKDEKKKRKRWVCKPFGCSLSPMRRGRRGDRKPRLAKERSPKGVGSGGGLAPQRGSAGVGGGMLLFNVTCAAFSVL